MTLGEIIKEKKVSEVNYISERTMRGNDDWFSGAMAYKNGEIISLDGDTYSLDMEVEKYEWWTIEEGDEFTEPFKVGDLCLTIYCLE